MEMGKYGVTCNAVAPLARTRAFVEGVPPAFEQAYKDGLVEKWFYEGVIDPGGPENCSAMVLYLATEHETSIQICSR